MRLRNEGEEGTNLLGLNGEMVEEIEERKGEKRREIGFWRLKLNLDFWLNKGFDEEEVKIWKLIYNQ